MKIGNTKANSTSARPRPYLRGAADRTKSASSRAFVTSGRSSTGSRRCDFAATRRCRTRSTSNRRPSRIDSRGGLRHTETCRWLMRSSVDSKFRALRRNCRTLRLAGRIWHPGRRERTEDTNWHTRAVLRGRVVLGIGQFLNFGTRGLRRLVANIRAIGRVGRRAGALTGPGGVARYSFAATSAASRAAASETPAAKMRPKSPTATSRISRKSAQRTRIP